MNNVYGYEKHEYDNLLLMGQAYVITDCLTIPANTALKRGSVLALKTDTNEAYLVDNTKTDGTQIPFAVLAEDVFKIPTSYEAVVYLAGEFNADALIVAPDSTIDDYKHDMWKAKLIVREVQNRRI